MKKITFITSNPAKAKYLSNYFDWPVDHKKLDLHEIQSLDLEEIVAEKAKSAFKIIGSPVLAEDVSLVFNAYKELPGPLVKWFLETLGNEGLIDLLKDKIDRRAIAMVSFCYCDGKVVKVFSAERKGSIAIEPQGEIGFGWDPIFIPEGHSKTWAVMNDDEKHATSMRKIALAKLKDYLENNK